MAVTVTPRWNNQSIEFRATTDNLAVDLEDFSFWQVTVDDPVTTQEAKQIAATADGIPRVYDIHPNNPWLFASSVRADVFRGPKSFLVTVNYRAIENPLAKPPDIKWTHASTNEPIDVDLDGKPIANSAGESPDPPFTDDVDDIVLRYKINLEFFNHLQATDYKGAVNEDLFLGFNPGTAKIKVFDGTRLRTGPFFYYEVLIEIHIRLKGWQLKFEDKGLRELVGVKDTTSLYGREIYSIDNFALITNDFAEDDADIQKVPITEPVSLNGAGLRLKKGDPKQFQEFVVKQSRPFAVLGIVLV